MTRSDLIQEFETREEAVACASGIFTTALVYGIAALGDELTILWAP